MRWLLVLICALCLASVQASETTHQSQNPADADQSLVEGDAKAGEQKAAPCAACHGPAGNSMNPVWPKLAGQHETYLFNQTRAFKSGDRKDPVMSAQAASLSEQDMRDLAAYFSRQSATIGAADPELADKGEALYRGGNEETGLTACIGCHGPKGLGNEAAGYARIGGQHVPYTAKALKDFRAGKRTGTAQAVMMTDVAKRLKNDEIEALAAYIQGLH